MNMNIKEQLDQYRWCMCLIKNRIDFLHELLKGKDGSASTGFLLPNIELGAVQIRKVLELIAMANMTANHNEYTPITESFKKQWNAKYIIQDIEKINPEFYPKPIKVSDDGNGVKRFTDIETNCLTKEKFINLYNWCNKRLHARNPYDSNKDEGIVYKNDLYKIEEARKDIIRLLNDHRCVLADNQTEIWCQMLSIEHNNKPLVVQMKKYKYDVA